jgi:SP family facilitated glucose transporter-like MFS transporter 8
MPLGAMFNCISAGIIIDKIGRKRSLLLQTIPIVVGYVFLMKPVNLIMMIIGRLLIGAGIGGTYVVGPVYLAEVSGSKNRGAFGCIFQILVAVGLLSVYTIAAYMSLFYLNLICGIFPLIFNVILCFIPESPVYYIFKNDIPKANRSLKWLGRSPYKKEESLKQEPDTVSNQEQNQEKSMMKILRRPESIRAFIIVLGVSFFQQYCGINAITFYTSDIFESAHTNLSPYLQTIVVGIVELLMSILSSTVVDRLGRRFLLIFSGIIMGICITLLGSYYHIDDLGYDLTNYSSIPLILLGSFTVAYSVGYGPLTYLIKSEVCAPDNKGYIVGFGITCTWLNIFIITKFYVNLVHLLKIGPTFWIFAINNFIGALFMHFVLPETKGKTLNEIQEILRGKK